MLSQDIRSIQNLLIRRLGQISPTCFLHRDDDASAIQSRIVRQLRPADNFWTGGLKRTAFAESHRPTRRSGSQEMKKFALLPGGERLVHEEGWAQFFVHLVKCGRSDVRRKQGPPTQQIQDLEQGRFSGLRQANQSKVGRNWQAFDEPSAHDKRCNQDRVLGSNFYTIKNDHSDSEKERDGGRVRLTSSREAHVLENPLPPRDRNEH